MTTSMVNPPSNSNGIHPDKVLRFIAPDSVKFLLTNWAWQGGKTRVRWDRYVLGLGIYCTTLRACKVDA